MTNLENNPAKNEHPNFLDVTKLSQTEKLALFNKIKADPANAEALETDDTIIYGPEDDNQI